jgi:hypothetical protein
MPIDDLVTVRDAAAELGVTPDALRNAVARGLLEPVRVGARFNLLPRDQIERYRQHHLRRRGPGARRSTP